MFRLILLTLLSYALAKPYQQAGTNFCADKQPGLFANGCSSNVTVCNKFGNEIWLLCPFELIFDESVDECMDPRLVSACSGTTPTPQGPVRDVQGLPDRLCEGSTDGYHSATGCSTSVVQCVGGVSRLLECSEGEVFDNAKQGCVPPAEMPACKAAMEPQPTAAPSSGAAQTTAAPSSGAAEPSGPSSSGAVEPSSPSGSGAAEPGSPPSSGAAEPTTAPTSGAADSSSPASSGPTNDCEGLADGFFEKEPCSSFFLTCSGGVSRILTCPASLVFDRKLSVCEYPENVEGCGSQEGEGPSGGAEICSKDGYFSYGNCSDLFYACSNGRQIPMYCPAKLAFDETRQLCDYPLAVAVCTEQGSGNVGQEAPGSKTPEDGSLDVPSESTTPASETAMALCKGKDDGFYASGCSSEAIACKAGQATSMLCPAHMLFDEHKRMCDYPENVPCYGTGEVEGVQQRKCTVEGPVGTGPCSRVFMNCVEGKAFQLACDDGYVFSVVHRSCAEASKVQECASAQSPTTEVEKPPMTEQPVQQPEQPVQQPEQPVQQPEQPVQQPEQPVPQPQQPTGETGYATPKPEQPVPQPQQPVPQPQQPVPQPQQPTGETGYATPKPEQPVQQPEQPSGETGYATPKPQQPVPQPQQPVPQPEQPTGETGYATPKPEQPVPQPQQPVPQPQQPVPQPQQPNGETGYATPKPEQPVQQPEQPAQQPEQPAQQPEQPAQQPEQPVQQPEQPVQQPEQPVQQPEQPAADDKKTKPMGHPSKPWGPPPPKPWGPPPPKPWGPPPPKPWGPPPPKPWGPPPKPWVPSGEKPVTPPTKGNVETKPGSY